jgi:hypothetical protein
MWKRMAFFRADKDSADQNGWQMPTRDSGRQEANGNRRLENRDRRLENRDRRLASGDRRLPPTGRLEGHEADGNGNGRVPANGNGQVHLEEQVANGNGHIHHLDRHEANGNGNGRLPPTRPEHERAAFGSGHLASGYSPADVTVSVVIPTLNEARNLPHVLPRIPSWVDEVVLVDGRSVDGTPELAAALLPGVRIVEQPLPGKGAALRAGFRAARGDIIVTLDADGSADPAEIPAFVGHLLAGADFAKGSRFLQGGGTNDMELVRRAGNWGLRALVRLGFGGRYSDLCYGYNAFWKDRVLPVIDGNADGFEIETLMNVRVLEAGMSVAEVPSYEAPRIHGESHLRTWRDGYRVLRTIVREWIRPTRPSRPEDAAPTPSTRSSVKEDLYDRHELERLDAAD